MAAKSKTAKKAPKAKRKAPRKKVAAKSRGLTTAEVAAAPSPESRALAQSIEEDGGKVLAQYKDPLGGHDVILAALPLEKVEPTPYQRDLSEPHVKRLANAMERVDRFLDPLIAVRQDGKYWTPNGFHRLGASRLLGTQTLIALVLPEPELAFQILALNTEKAHNLKERALEVIRMYRGLLEIREGTEASMGSLFEEAAFITLGAAYQKRPRLSGGAYHSIVKRLDAFLEEPLAESLEVREERADMVLQLDDAVTKVVEALKSRGMTSPYLKAFVVARINYLRFVKPDKTPEFDDAMEKLIAAASKFNVERVKKEDVGRAGGAPEEPDEG